MIRTINNLINGKHKVSSERITPDAAIRVMELNDPTGFTITYWDPSFVTCQIKRNQTIQNVKDLLGDLCPKSYDTVRKEVFADKDGNKKVYFDVGFQHATVSYSKN